jgi:hypothetical protein
MEAVGPDSTWPSLHLPSCRSLLSYHSLDLPAPNGRERSLARSAESRGHYRSAQVHGESLYSYSQRQSYLYSDIEGLNLTDTVDSSQIQTLQGKLEEIEQKRVGGKFMDAQGKLAPGQAIMYQLLWYHVLD